MGRGGRFAVLAGAIAGLVGVPVVAPPAVGGTIGASFTGEVEVFEGVDVVGAIENRVVLSTAVVSGQAIASLLIVLRIEDPSAGDQSCLRVDVDAPDLEIQSGNELSITGRVNVVQAFSTTLCSDNTFPNASTAPSTIDVRIGDNVARGTILVGDDPLTPLEFEATTEEPAGSSTGPTVQPGATAGLDALLQGNSVLDQSASDLLGRLGNCPLSQTCTVARDRADLAKRTLVEALSGQIDPTVVADLGAIVFTASLRDTDGRLVSPSMTRMLPILIRLLAQAAALEDEGAHRAANRLAGFILIADLENR